MPELPEVEIIKTALEKFLIGQKILKVEVKQNKFRIKTPDNFADTITNCKILSIKRRAKYLIINLSNNYSIINHLGMSGQIKTLKNKPQILEKHDHIIIECNNYCIIYNDSRRFGLMTYCKTSEIKNHKLFSHLGVEPLSNKFTGKYLFDKIKNKKSPIKPNLLDQSIVVGIGNIYASELLYDAKISPIRPCNMISLEECKRIVVESKNVLNRAIKAGGSTLKDYKKPDGSLGYFQNEHKVYGKENQICLNCKSIINQKYCIKKIVQAGRSSFYCPITQK
jgi:formamidopyrimidine-DNA glycosylase